MGSMRRGVTWGVIATAITAIAAYVVWSRARAHHAETEAAVYAPDPSLTKTIDVEPWGLTARIDDKWSCRFGDHGTVCARDGWGVRWRVETESDQRPIDAIIRAIDFEGPRTRVSLAGFEGVMLDATCRSPASCFEFEGWRDDPKQGRRKLSIQAELEGHSDVDVHGFVMTTSIGPRGLPDHLPTDEDFDSIAQPNRGWETLNDTNAQTAWARGALDVSIVPKTPFGVAFMHAREPSVSSLLQRGTERASTAKEAKDALTILQVLEQWDPAAATPAATKLAGKVRNAWSPEHADPAWIEVDLLLAERRQRLGDASAMPDIIALLERVDRADVLRAPGDSLWVIARQPKLDAAARLLERWIDPNHFPTDADVSRMASFAFQLKNVPAIRRYLMAMLSSQAVIGSVDIEDGGARVLGELVRENRDTLPHDGTKLPLRACDAYTWSLKSQGAPAIILWSSETLRNRAVASTRAWLADH